MATMKEHIFTAHRNSAEYHSETAKYHKTMSASEDESEKHHRELAECFKAMDGFEKAAEHHNVFAQQAGLRKAQHDRMEQHHSEMARYHSDCAQTLKAAIDADLQKLVPDRVSSIVGTDAPESAFANIRAVARHGAPRPSELLDTSAVPVQFRHLISSMDED